MKFFTGSLYLGSKKLLSTPHPKPHSDEMFTTWTEYAQCLIDSINETVGENDELYILGNFTRRKPGKHRRRIKCRNVYLIRGDCDPPQASRHVFGAFPDMKKMKLRKGENEKGSSVILSHYPMAYWEGSHHGRGHLYARPQDKREKVFKNRIGLPHQQSFNCCVENLYEWFGDYRPISEVRLLEILEHRKSNHPVEEH
jgi:calcineurin-like phosphoesterase family protein